MNNKGITLIALVITIIVLLILAGVSISFVSGDNGIIKKSQAAKLNTEQANIVEQLQLIISEKMMEIKSELENENEFSDYKIYIDYLTEKGIIKYSQPVESSDLPQAGQGMLVAQPILMGLQIQNNLNKAKYYILDVNKLVENAKTGQGDLESGDVYYILGGNLFYVSENKECTLLKEIFEMTPQKADSILDGEDRRASIIRLMFL